MAFAQAGGLIRIFMSSTFIDFQQERARLQTIVLPLLRERARAKGCDVAFIDLRWGLSDAVSTKGGYIHVCLSAAREADLVLGLLGGRYGACPAHRGNLDLDQFQIEGQLRGAVERGVADGLSITHMELAYTSPERRLVLCRDDSLTRHLEATDLMSRPVEGTHPGRWIDPVGSPSAKRAAALLQELQDEGTPVLSYASLDEFTGLARERLLTWLDGCLVSPRVPEVLAIPLVPHTEYACQAARKLLETGSLLITGEPNSGKTVFLGEVTQALTELAKGLGAAPQIKIHRLELAKGDLPYRALEELIDEILGRETRLGLADPFALDPQALLAIRGLSSEPVPVIVVDGLDDVDLSEPPAWLFRLTGYVMFILAGRMGLQMLQLHKAGWDLVAPPTFARREDAEVYLRARFLREFKYLTPEQVNRILNVKDGIRLSSLNRFLELILSFGDLVQGKNVDEHVTANIDGLLAEHQVHGGWEYILLMLLNCQPNDFAVVLEAIAGFVVARRGLSMEEVETSLARNAGRAGEIVTMLAGMLEWSNGRAYLRDAVNVSKTIPKMQFLQGLQDLPRPLELQEFWCVMRLGATLRLLNSLRPWERTVTDEEMADVLHLFGEMAELKPLSLIWQERVRNLLQNGALGVALRSGNFLWLGSFLTLRSVPNLESLLLAAVRDHTTGVYWDTLELLSLVRFIGRHGQSGNAPIGLAPALAALIAEAHLRQQDAGWNRERARLAWLALNEWLSLLSKSLAKCESVEEIDRVVESAGRAMDGVNKVAPLLDGTHRVAGDIFVRGVWVAHMTALERLKSGSPNPTEILAIGQYLGKIRKTINEGAWPFDATVELERRLVAVAEGLLTLSAAKSNK